MSCIEFDFVTLAHRTQSRDWEQNDYYDSDEDNFLDRTGDGGLSVRLLTTFVSVLSLVDKKRIKRMKKAGKTANKAETFESLVSNNESHTTGMSGMKRISYTPIFSCGIHVYWVNNSGYFLQQTKLSGVEQELAKLQQQLSVLRGGGGEDEEGGDSLDVFMKSVGHRAERGKITEIKLRIHQLKKVYFQIILQDFCIWSRRKRNS